MANPTTVFEQLVADVLAMMDGTTTSTEAAAAGNSFPRTNTDGAWPNLLIEQNIAFAFVDVAVLVINTPGHAARAAYMADSSALSHKDIIPDHVGAIGSVTVRHTTAGTYEQSIPRSLYATSMMARRATYQAQPYHHVTDDDRLLFTGHLTEKRAIVRYVPLTLADAEDPDSYTALSPDLLSAIKIRACFLVATKAGDTVALGEFWRRAWNEEIGRLKLQAAPEQPAIERVSKQ